MAGGGLKEEFEKKVRAADMVQRFKPYKKSLSPAVNEKAVKRSIGSGVEKQPP